jgi:hypothetical protein
MTTDAGRRGRPAELRGNLERLLRYWPEPVV